VFLETTQFKNGNFGNFVKKKSGKNEGGEKRSWGGERGGVPSDV